MYCHTHRCQIHHCHCGSNNSTGQGGAFDETKFVELTQEFKDELKKYTVLLKDEIINHSAGIDYDRLNDKISDLELRDLKIVGDLNDRINTTVELSNLKHQQQDTEIQAAKDTLSELKGVESISELLTITNPYEGMRIYVKSYHLGLDLGGGYFVYDSSKASINDGGVIINGWVRDTVDKYVSPEWWGAKKDGVTDDAEALQAATNYASSLKGIVWISEGTYAYDTIIAKSDVIIDGVGTLKQIQPDTARMTGIVKEGWVPLNNFTIRNISMDGGRTANGASMYNNIIYFDMRTDKSRNLIIENVKFKDSQQAFIKFTCFNQSGFYENIRVENCEFITSPDKIKLDGVYTDGCGSAVRLEQVHDSGPNGGHGVINFNNIVVKNNYAKHIRCLADIKRGCKNWVVSYNYTEDMFDCNHNADGSFNGVFCYNKGKWTPETTIASTYANFFEIQGDNIQVFANHFDGGMRAEQAIFVTDYGRPKENGKGYTSHNIVIRDNHVKNIKYHAFKLLNTHNCVIEDNHVDTTGHRALAVDSGTGRDDGAGNKLTAKGNIVRNNILRNCELGGYLKGSNNIWGANLDVETYSDYYDIGKNNFVPMDYSLIVENPPVPLNRNPYLEVEHVTDEATPDIVKGYQLSGLSKIPNAAASPFNQYDAITLNDTLTNNISVLYAKEFVPVSYESLTYVVVTAKQNSTQEASLMVQEYRGNTLFKTVYIRIPIYTTQEWKTYVAAYSPSDPEVTKVMMGISPATITNWPSSIGSTDFAYFGIFRKYPSARI